MKTIEVKTEQEPIVSDSIVVTGNTTAVIREGMADGVITVTNETSSTFQLEPGSYIVDFYRVSKDVNLPYGATGMVQNSPNCGYHPYVGNGVIGYSATQVGTTYSMLTNTTHFKKKTTGENVDVWRPHAPMYMEWIYAYKYKYEVNRTIKVINAAKHLAFTSIGINSNRNKLIIVYREGTSHASFDGRIMQIESNDNGSTWINNKVIYTPPVGSDARDPQLLILPDDTIICRFFERKSDNEMSVKCIKSSNFGVSYQTPISLPSNPSPLRANFAAARGNMLLLNGTIYSVSYDSVGAWLVKSNDNGNSWNYVSNIPNVNEVSLGYENGKIFFIGRPNTTGSKAKYGISSDLGMTWTIQDMDIYADAPSLTAYNNGYILTFRNNVNAPNEYTYDFAFVKNGIIVSDIYTLYKDSQMDIGYGDVVLSDDSFYVVCYTPNTIRFYDINYAIFN